ncbi:NUDIX hydrolase [Luedemannella helvata]|uniref:Nudix hydrolase domain-containing protein n=1 Tax=Luedemannella helvata TaxID=349315 RepID=A0ABN2KMT3_9ACTN
MTLLTSTVAAVITDTAGRVLLCQQRQGHQLWGLPGGGVRPGESPAHAVVRDVRTDTGTETEIVDLVGLYQLTGDGCGTDLPDVLVHVFRGRLAAADVAVNAPGRISRLAWHDPAHLPEPVTATTRAAIADALAGRSGVVREVLRDVDPDLPDDETAIPTQQPPVISVS